MDALSERNKHTGTSAMRVFANHIYEAEDIDFELQEVGNGRTNIFFGRSECIEVVRRMITRPLQQLSPEEDFILGALLGYDICMQCERFCKRTACTQKVS